MKTKKRILGIERDLQYDSQTGLLETHGLDFPARVLNMGIRISRLLSLPPPRGQGLRGWERATCLTDRQLEILQLVAGGVDRKGIARQVFVSETTVNRKMRNIFNRLGVNDAAHAVAEAHRRRLL